MSTLHGNLLSYYEALERASSDMLAAARALKCSVRNGRGWSARRRRASPIACQADSTCSARSGRRPAATITRRA